MASLVTDKTIEETTNAIKKVHISEATAHQLLSSSEVCSESQADEGSDTGRPFGDKLERDEIPLPPNTIPLPPNMIPLPLSRNFKFSCVRP